MNPIGRLIKLIEINKIHNKIAVVIPSFKVKKHILSVINNIGEDISIIYVIDDACPENTGSYVEANCSDNRVVVIRNVRNLGVGGAVMEGYKAAIMSGAEIIVKVDGDGQMDPALIPLFLTPIIKGEADYTKGNRFYNIESLEKMPRVRLFGNAILSFMTKISSGYWDLFDPTNGYTAIHSDIARQLPFSKISNRYFFETDILFRLNTLRAVAIDIPMDAKYSGEVSNLKVHRVVGDFMIKHIKNFSKRIFYNYYLRDMSIASIELPLGVILLLFSVIYGSIKWFSASETGISTPSGTVMLSALPALMGLQLILAFFAYDISAVPRIVRTRINRKDIVE